MKNNAGLPGITLVGSPRGGADIILTSIKINEGASPGQELL